MSKVILILHDVRSCHNVGSMLRTAEGLGVDKVYLTGYSPYPMSSKDKRLPHVVRRAHQRINKTSLGAQDSIRWEHRNDIRDLIQELRNDGLEICALEQSPDSTPLPSYAPSGNVALIVGNEVSGLNSKLLSLASKTLEIPMRGQKESFNVSIAAAIALYSLTNN